MLILSGPVELLILLCLIASWTCDIVSCKNLYRCCMQFTNVSVYYSVCATCFIVVMNYLLNAFVICLSMVIEYYTVILYLDRLFIATPCMVLHSLCVFCLWSHCLFMCSFKMSALYCFLREVNF